MGLVSVQLIPMPLPELGRGRFSFYPAILGVKHNEWMLRRATWTEILVVNTKTAEELWIARRFLGDVSPVEAPVRIVGLLKELEYKEGLVLPHRRGGVIEMPRAANDYARLAPRREPDGRPAQVVAIRVEPHSESRVFRLLRSSAALGILACLGIIFLVRDAHLGQRLGWSTATPRIPSLTGDDDYASVVKKLGAPSSDRWERRANGEGYRRLLYARRAVTIVLAGRDPGSARYTAMLNRDGLVVNAAAPTVLDGFLSEQIR
jgi:hypothetical protein